MGRQQVRANELQAKNGVIVLTSCIPVPFFPVPKHFLVSQLGLEEYSQGGGVKKRKLFSGLEKVWMLLSVILCF